MILSYQRNGFMIKVTLSNDILKKISVSAIDENRFSLGTIELPQIIKNRLRKNSNSPNSRQTDS